MAAQPGRGQAKAEASGWSVGSWSSIDKCRTLDARQGNEVITCWLSHGLKP